MLSLKIIIFLIYLINSIHYSKTCSCSIQQYPILFCKSKFAAIVMIRSGPLRLNPANLTSNLSNHINHLIHKMLKNESSNLLPNIDTNIYYYKAEIHHPFKLNEHIKYRNDRKNFVRVWIHHQPGNSCNAKLKLNQLYLVWSNLNEDYEPIVNFCNAIPYEHLKSSTREFLNRITVTGLRCR